MTFTSPPPCLVFSFKELEVSWRARFGGSTLFEEEQIAEPAWTVCLVGALGRLLRSRREPAPLIRIAFMFVGGAGSRRSWSVSDALARAFRSGWSPGELGLEISLLGCFVYFWLDLRSSFGW